MKKTQSKLLAATTIFLTVAWAGASTAAEKPPSEIELMKLEFSLACEQSPSCIEKRKDGRSSDGKEKMIFRTYKTGTETSEHNFKIKSGTDRKD